MRYSEIDSPSPKTASNDNSQLANDDEPTGISQDAISSLSAFMRDSRQTHDRFQPGDRLMFGVRPGTVEDCDPETVTLAMDDGNTLRIVRNHSKLTVAPLEYWK